RGSALPFGAARARPRGGARRHAPRRSARDDLVRERGAARARARHRGDRARGFRAAGARPAALRPRARFPVLVLLPPHAARRDPCDAAARRLQHARLAAAEISRARAGELGDPPRRARDRRDAARDGREARRGTHRGPDGGADPARRPRGGRLPQGDGCRRDRPRPRAPRARRGKRAPRSPGSRAGLLLRRPQARGRPHRLGAGRARDPRPGARRRAALSRRVHHRRRRDAARASHQVTGEGAAFSRALGGRSWRRPAHRRRERSSRRALRRRHHARDPRGRARRPADFRIELPQAVRARRRPARRPAMKKLCILGVNGFIGHHLSQRILKDTGWEVFGMDMSSDRVADLLEHERFHFFEGDITINKEWIEYHIRKCDVVLPLVAIATPATYVKEPLRVFELDFEANLPIVRHAVKYGKRVIFPSTSEVYGMSRDSEFDPDRSELVYGPINKPRWIYACAKQLMDRVIAAYGQQEGLDYTLFRPFNWIGAGLDSIHTAKEGSSRVITQFFGHIVRGEPIKLVDGGTQKRAFTYIDDGIDALVKIIENKNGIASGKIYNVGNPRNNYSVRELAKMMIDLALLYPEYRDAAKKVTT